jgi:hypothetical protein
MRCFYCILTSLISQALLQAALDKKERDFTCWFFQYEFLNLPVPRQAEAQQHFVQCQCQSSDRIDGNRRNTHHSRHWHNSHVGWVQDYYQA